MFCCARGGQAIVARLVVVWWRTAGRELSAVVKTLSGGPWLLDRVLLVELVCRDTQEEQLSRVERLKS